MKYLLSADRVLAGSRLDEIRNGAVVTEDEKILFAGIWRSPGNSIMTRRRCVSPERR